MEAKYLCVLNIRRIVLNIRRIVLNIRRIVLNIREPGRRARAGYRRTARRTP
jgi:hypothetical protein